MKKNKTYKPDWTPKNAGKEFAVNIVKGINPTKSKSRNMNNYSFVLGY